MTLSCRFAFLTLCLSAAAAAAAPPATQPQAVAWPDVPAAANIKVVCDRWPDGSSLRQFSLDAIRLSGANTEKEQALAVLRWMRRWTMFTNSTAPNERGQSVLDNLKILHVYGAHWCDGRALLMENLWRSIGGRAWKLYAPDGYTMALVHWTDDDGVGRWHQVHASRGWYLYDRPGKLIATPDQIGADLSLMFRPSVTGQPRTGFPPRPWNWIAVGHRDFSTHDVTLDLRPGESYVRQWSNEGVPACNNVGAEQYNDGEHGPYPITYGNGRFVSTIDLGAKELARTADGRCELVCPVRLPHVIADGWLDVSPRNEPPAGLKAQIGFDGRTFFDLPTGRGPLVELGPRCRGEKNLVGRYRFLLKLSWPARASTPARLNLTLIAQHNLFSLPQLWPGRNVITVSADLPRGRQLIVGYEWADAGGKKRNFARVEQTPFSYPITAAGGQWADVKCERLTVAVGDADGRGNRVAEHEPPADVQPLASRAAALPGMDQIVGEKHPAPLKQTADYVADLADPAKRVEALDGLMVLRDPAAGPALVELLCSADKMELEVRGRVVQAIYWSLDRKAAFDALLAVVTRDPKVKWVSAGGGEGWGSISSLVAHLAGVCDYQPAIPALIEGFNRGVGMYNRPAYLRAFGRLRAAAAVPLCVKSLSQHSDISAPAAEALGLIGDPAAVPALIKAVEERIDSKRFQMLLYAEAARALGRLNGRSPEAIAMLERLLGNEDEEVRGAAAEALGKVGGARHIAALRAAAAKEPFGWVRLLMAAAAERLARDRN